MTPDIAICLTILGCAVLMFMWDRIPADVVALGVMVAVVLTGLLPTSKAFAGFGSDTVIMIFSLLVMSAGLVQTGVVDIAGRRLFNLAGSNQAVFLPLMMASVASVSAFMSNTAATAFFVPLVLGYAKKINASPSRFLLPLAFASILTSSVTLISTSTNLIVSELFTRYQQPPMGMFELTPVGIPIAIIGILYMWLVGGRLLGQRGDQKADEELGERIYQADVIVTEGSPLTGKSLKEAKLAGDASDFRVVKVLRGSQSLRGGTADLVLEEGDELFIEGRRADLLKIKNIEGLDFKADVHLAKPEEKKKEKEMAIVEGVLLPRAPLIGQSLRRLEFKERYGLQVLALHRAGRVPQTISSARLRMGDVLLLQGTPENVKALERGNLFNIFGGVEFERLNRARAPHAAAIFVGVIAAGTAKLITFPLAMLIGAFMMLLTRCLSPEEAYRQVEWKALVLIGSLFSLGAAMEASGAGAYLAQQLIGILGKGSTSLLTAFFVLTVALTQPMSNQAAALVVFPIAIQTALQLGVDPRPFGMMVAIAASCSYLTPLEPSCLLVYGPGKYRFMDFFKVGFPLTIVIYVLAMLLVPLAWPLGR
jgi:di/tricarboxylate transporter